MSRPLPISSYSSIAHALGPESPTIQHGDNVPYGHDTDGVQRLNAAIETQTYCSGQAHGLQGMPLEVEPEVSPMDAQVLFALQPSAPQAPIVRVPPRPTGLPFLRLRPHAITHVPQRQPTPPNSPPKNVSLKEIEVHGMVIPASENALAELAEFRWTRWISATQLRAEQRQFCRNDLQVGLLRHCLPYASRRARVIGLRPEEKRIVDRERNCTYCMQYHPNPLRHFFGHLMAEMRHNWGFPICAQGRQWILSTPDRLTTAFEFWERPTFRCPQCWYECDCSDSVVEHLEHHCEYLLGDLAHIQAWARERPPVELEIRELLESLGFTGLPVVTVRTEL